MSADVLECTQFVVFAAHDENTVTADVRSHVVANACDLTNVADKLPTIEEERNRS